MGRWSQARRTGGGPLDLNWIVSATTDDTIEVIATYRKPINASTLTAADFSSLESGEPGLSLANTAPNMIQILFSGPIVGDQVLRFAGAQQHVVTPQQVTYD